MAITGVLRPGHAVLRVLDLDESVHFYTEVLGLKETGRDKSGRVYFKCWDERDHNSFVIRKADRAGMDCFGFKVQNAAVLNTLEGRLREYGVVTERVPAGEMLETGERVRFHLPTGHLIELYAEKTSVGNGLGDTNPEAWLPDQKGISPIRMDHALIYGGDIDGNRKLFEEVLDFTLVERVKLEDGVTDLATWLTCSNKAHDIAMVRHSEDNKLHHVSFLLETWEQVLRAADIMSMNRVPSTLARPATALPVAPRFTSLTPRATAWRLSAVATSGTPTTPPSLGRGTKWAVAFSTTTAS